MTRSRLLIVAVVMVFAAAGGLRLRSHLMQAQEADPVGTRPAGPAAAMPVPRDYVAHPWVAPDEVDRGPGRIVSLAPSVTEVVCALGLRDRLVGRTQFCQHPPGVTAVREVGAMLDTNFELIQSLEPDLVLTISNSGPVPDRLRELGIHHACVPHESLAEVYTAIERIGDLCERPKTAGALAAAIRADLQSLEATSAGLAGEPMKVLVVLGPLPVPPGPVWVAGPGSFLDSLLRRAGHQNAAAAALTSPHGELPLEKLLALDVDVILTFGAKPSPRQWADLYESWSPLAPLRAIRQQRVRRVGGDEWLSAGPRIAIGLHGIVSALSTLHE